MKKTKILIAGIGGASLGTEIFKCLAMTKRYDIVGCDISKLAFGHYQQGFCKTSVVDRDNYVESVAQVCTANGIQYIIPGGEQPMVLLAEGHVLLEVLGIKLVGNNPALVERFSNKETTFKILSEETFSAMGIKVPLTIVVKKPEDLDSMSYPCIIKPSTGSGGSVFVFLAGDRDEALLYASYIVKNGREAIAQEYLPEGDGEFTIGVLSLPNQQVVGSIAMRRLFNSKLSVLYRGPLGLISTGYSQGCIDRYPNLCKTAEQIATLMGSEGPINIQGRVRNGVFVPFEINPRFSASTYLRAMAGFNEIDIFMQYLITGNVIQREPLRPGNYLRSFTETYVPFGTEVCP